MKPSNRYVPSGSSVLMFLVACSSVPPASPIEGNVYRPTDDIGERAEQVLRSDAPFDLRLPDAASGGTRRRHAASDALLAACRAEHYPSCWTLLAVATTEDARELGAAIVIAQCRKGDLMSCQAIPPYSPHPLVPAGLPGEMGRAQAKHHGGRATEDEAIELRRECDEGFAYSCKALADRSPDLTERPAMHDKLSLAARAGCRYKIPYVCLLVEDTWPEAERIAALDWNCQIWRRECVHLGAALLAAGRHDAARGEYERACQYGTVWTCLELAELYRDGTLAEPIDGRSATIVRIACAELERLGMADDYPACASFPATPP